MTYKTQPGWRRSCLYMKHRQETQTEWGRSSVVMWKSSFQSPVTPHPHHRQLHSSPLCVYEATQTLLWWSSQAALRTVGLVHVAVLVCGETGVINQPCDKQLIIDIQGSPPSVTCTWFPRVSDVDGGARVEEREPRSRPWGWRHGGRDPGGGLGWGCSPWGRVRLKQIWEGDWV